MRYSKAITDGVDFNSSQVFKSLDIPHADCIY